MRVFYSGFNLYGQFINYPNLTVEGFIDCLYDEVADLELSHTFSVIFKENSDVFLHGAKDGKSHQIQKVQIPETIEIAQTCCTDKRLLLLSKNGLLFKLDFNNSDKFVPTPLPNTFTNESEKEKDHYTKIACGSKINIVLTQQGKLFNLPNQLNFESKNIVDICAGREHCLILDSEGNIYSFGRGSRGQLGHGNLEDELEPKLVQALAGIKISKIATGGWHSCAVGAEGDLYCWGWNGNGQLGLGKTNEEAVSVMALPHVVDFEDVQTQKNLNLNVVNVACGNRHTVVLLENGKLFGAGWNKYHQLGNTNIKNENFYAMTFLYDFSNLNVINLKCGPWSTAIVVK